jgi:hypothetical protein
MEVKNQLTVAEATDVKMNLSQDGKITVLKESTPLKSGRNNR